MSVEAGDQSVSPISQGSSPSSPNIAEPRSTIISTIQHPLGFFSLIVLIAELCITAAGTLLQGNDRSNAVFAGLLLIFLTVALVALLATFRPEALRGERPRVIEPTIRAPNVSDHPARVDHVSNPSILCVSTKEFEGLGFDDDVKIVKSHFAKGVKVLHNASSDSLSACLASNQFDVIHILAQVDAASGTLVFGSDDRLEADGFAALVRVTKARLVVLATCDSVILAARVLRSSNMIAANGYLEVEYFHRWIKTFYTMLEQGQSLSAACDVASKTVTANILLMMKQDLTFA